MNTINSNSMIHPTAIVDSEAIIHSGVSIGPYSIIGPEVEIGENTVIQNHVTLSGPTKIGPGGRIYPYASVGSDPQDKKYKGERSFLEIGKDCLIRENVTINRGTDEGGGVTKIGDRAWIMAYGHVAHDCIVGDDVVMSNGAHFGGHVTVGKGVIAGAFSAAHQFCKIGDYSMIGAYSAVVQDVVPFTIAAGNRIRLAGVNKIGLERNGFSSEEIKEIQEAYRIFFKKGLGKNEALELLEKEFPQSNNIWRMIDFIKNAERGICR